MSDFNQERRGLCVMCLFLRGPASISYPGLPNRPEGNDCKTSSRELRTFLENFFPLFFFFKSVKCQGERVGMDLAKVNVSRAERESRSC